MASRRVRESLEQRAVRQFDQMVAGTLRGRAASASPTLRGAGGAGTGGGGGGAPRTALFTFGGALVVGASVAWRPTFGGQIAGIRCNTTVAPTGTITVDVLKNAASLFTLAAKPTVPGPAEYGDTAYPDTTTWVPNDKLQIEVENVGTDGANLVVAIDYWRA